MNNFADLFSIVCLTFKSDQKVVFKRGSLFSEVVVRWVSAVLICCLVVDAGVWHGLFCFLTKNGIRVWYIDHISDNANLNVIERRIM